MVRTKRGRSSKADHVRSAAYVRRKRGGPRNSLENDTFENNVKHEKLKIEDEGYLGGSMDTSFQINYEEHMARH